MLCGLALVGLLALPWRPGARRAALHGLVFLAGLLAKDGFGPFIVVVVAMDWAERRAPALAAPRWVAVGSAVAAWLVARALLGLPGFGMPPLQELPGLYLDAVRIYFVRAIVPPPLTTGHPYAPGGAIGIALGAAVLLVLAASVVRRRRLAVPVAVFLAGLVPAAVAIGKFGQVPERYFYVPSIGLALIVGDVVGLCMASRRSLVRLSAPVAVGLVTLAGLVRLEARLPDWRSDGAVFAAALRVHPDDAEANLTLGIAAGRRAEWGEARRMLEIAQRTDPHSGRIASAFAWALLRSGDIAGGLRQAERATEVAPHQPDAWFYLAMARHQSGDHSGELSAIERILELSPDFPGARRFRALAACEASGRPGCVEAVEQGAATR